MITHANEFPSSQRMDHDVDMDAPQISTLKEDTTPPPQPKFSGSRRGKASNKSAAPQHWPRPRPKGMHTDEEYEEEEDQQDQLIDDDDDMMKPVPPASLPHSNRSSDGTSKKKTPSKRKRKAEKSAADEKKSQEKTTLNEVVAPDLGPTLGWFKAAPPEASESDSLHVDATGEEETPRFAKLSAVSRTPRKQQTKNSKSKSALPILADDVGIASEGYAGTAASSPVTGHLEGNTPEPDTVPVVETAPLVEEMNITLENIPLPIYPLPTKPFPVQQPAKIATGFAPPAALDKNRRKVRHWRVAQREIRGIAGGRWFTRSWVGEKDSEYATVQKSAEEKLAVPRLVGSALSSPVGKGSGKGKKASSSLVASLAPSRSGSSIPEGPPIVGTVRNPTKMRTIIRPPSEEGESDAIPIPIS